MTEWFVVEDLPLFTKTARVIIYKNFGNEESVSDVDMQINTIKPKDQEELDAILTQNESEVIVKGLLRKQKNKKTDQVRYVVNHDIFVEILESLNSRMVSNLLSSLVNKGLLESSYDAELDDFTFWIKENTDEEKSEKPETD